MNVSIEIVKAQDFLKTTASGELDLNKCKELLCKIVEKAAEHNKHNILIDIRGTSSYKLGTIELYSLVAEMEKFKKVLNNKIAILDDADENFNKVEFIEMCAKNRGFMITAVSEYEDAITWLNQ